MVLSGPPTPAPAGSPSWTRGTDRLVRREAGAAGSDLANAGLYVVDAAAYREIAAMGAFDLGFDVLPRFVGRMRGWVWGGYHLDIGTHEALERARREVASAFPDQAADRRWPAPTRDLPRSRRHPHRACPLSLRSRAGPPAARGRRGTRAFPACRIRTRAGDQSVGHRSRRAHDERLDRSTSK